MDRRIKKGETVKFIVTKTENSNFELNEIIELKSEDISWCYDNEEGPIFGLYHDEIFDCWVNSFIEKFVNGWDYEVTIEELN